MAAWLPLVALGLHLAARGAAGAGCGACQPERCAAVSCAAPELAARDECGCCRRCLGAEGARCGGPRGARCGAGLVCVSRRAEGPPGAGADAEGSGRCVCEEDGAVCGSDGRSYGSVCALRLHSWRALHGGRERVRKAHDGECKLVDIQNGIQHFPFLRFFLHNNPARWVLLPRGAEFCLPLLPLDSKACATCHIVLVGLNKSCRVGSERKLQLCARGGSIPLWCFRNVICSSSLLDLDYWSWL